MTTFDKAIMAILPLLLLVIQNLGSFGLDTSTMWWVNLLGAVITPVLVYLKSNKVPVAPASKP